MTPPFLIYDAGHNHERMCVPGDDGQELVYRLGPGGGPWVVEPPGVPEKADTFTVGQVLARLADLPGARVYVIERTRKVAQGLREQEGEANAEGVAALHGHRRSRPTFDRARGAGSAAYRLELELDEALVRRLGDILSTASWDQHRNATTITLHRPDARTATVGELLAQLRRESPHLVDPAIDFVHGRHHDDRVCCLISWRNTSVVPVTTHDVRLRAADLLEQHGWTPNRVPEGARPLNTYRALQEAAAQLGVPSLRMLALRELRGFLGMDVESIFDWEAGTVRTKRPGFEPEFHREPRSQAQVLAALRGQPLPAAEAC